MVVKLFQDNQINILLDFQINTIRLKLSIFASLKV